MKDINWFKQVFESNLKEYHIEYRFFKDGDLGDLNQVEFNSKQKGGEIDFWSSGWVYIHFINYTNNEELMNILLKPEENKDKHLFKLNSLL
ncbi:hypothetical protein SAMN05443634_1231 [Chishuiella changwenlii]|uniref:Uncharacterized protein n=1 Tax=Chishuiella changwenlii TaxID=1434701 RepID=A0A1M7DAD7_9FLAO|nr:hypothetical protein [Chishuiella changwenlii]SHL76420.1 hypothetical protein SAMN05443634_1231 [Chishuiella changwenlii]